MKSLTIIIGLILVASFSAFSQTTEEEYNYLTKGYKFQIESGLDMKKGYTLQDLTSHNVGERKTEFKALFRDGEDKPCAVLCIYNRPSTGFKDYICIPHFDSDKAIWDKVYEKIKTYGGDGAIALAWGTLKLSAYYAK